MKTLKTARRVYKDIFLKNCFFKQQLYSSLSKNAVWKKVIKTATVLVLIVLKTYFWQTVSVNSHASPFYLAYRGQCLCYSGQFICAKPDQSKGGKKDKVIGRSSLPPECQLRGKLQMVLWKWWYHARASYSMGRDGTAEQTFYRQFKTDVFKLVNWFSRRSVSLRKFNKKITL